MVCLAHEMNRRQEGSLPYQHMKNAKVKGKMFDIGGHGQQEANVILALRIGF